mmetsp:Transcript_77478/g.136660  ORF Transcript_77478/g.136660 Transcript_77478/m.136660 type:complete len:264 (+) Transcript_77478:340-1131(+)
MVRRVAKELGRRGEPAMPPVLPQLALKCFASAVLKALGGLPRSSRTAPCESRTVEVSLWTAATFPGICFTSRTGDGNDELEALSGLLRSLGADSLEVAGAASMEDLLEERTSCASKLGSLLSFRPLNSVTSSLSSFSSCFRSLTSFGGLCSGLEPVLALRYRRKVPTGEHRVGGTGCCSGDRRGEQARGERGESCKDFSSGESCRGFSSGESCNGFSSGESCKGFCSGESCKVFCSGESCGFRTGESWGFCSGESCAEFSKKS